MQLSIIELGLDFSSGEVLPLTDISCWNHYFVKCHQFESGQWEMWSEASKLLTNLLNSKLCCCSLNISLSWARKASNIVNIVGIVWVLKTEEEVCVHILRYEKQKALFKIILQFSSFYFLKEIMFLFSPFRYTFDWAVEFVPNQCHSKYHRKRIDLT